MKCISKNAFSMIELVFVVVVLGILASLAIPKFAATRTDAIISKGRADIATIRSAIITERQSQIIKGVTSWIPKLSSGTTTLFTGDGSRTLLTYGIKASTGNDGWSGTDPDYVYKVAGSINKFSYNKNDGTFTCTSGAECGQLAH